MAITWNSNNKGTNVTLSNNNLTANCQSTNNNSAIATKGYSTGKWYWEITVSQVGHIMIGIALSTFNVSGTYIGGNSDSYSYYMNGNKYHNGVATSYGSIYQTIGDTIGIALDLDNKTITFYKNGVSQGIAYSGLPDGTYYAAVSNGSSDINISTINFGSIPFKYTIPTGFKMYDILSKFLIKQGTQYYSIKPEFYQDGKFTPLVLLGGDKPNDDDYNNQGFDDVNILCTDMTIGEETFKPIDKVDNQFQIKKYISNS